MCTGLLPSEGVKEGFVPGLSPWLIVSGYPCPNFPFCLLLLLLLLFFFFCLFRAALMAYGGSQARGRIGAVAASLHHSHGNVGSEPRL